MNTIFYKEKEEVKKCKKKLEIVVDAEIMEVHLVDYLADVATTQKYYFSSLSFYYYLQTLDVVIDKYTKT